MKKKLFFALMLSVVMAGAWFVVENQTQPKLSDVALANIEALASGEGGSSAPCYTSLEESDKIFSLVCGLCEYAWGKPVEDAPTGNCEWN